MLTDQWFVAMTKSSPANHPYFAGKSFRDICLDVVEATSGSDAAGDERIRFVPEHWTSTYNQGTFIGLANFLGQVGDATLAANYTRDNLASAGIMPQYGIAGNNSGFNAIFFRWMTRFMRDHKLQRTYEPWLQANAEAAWNVRRNTDGLSWCQWQQPTPTGTNLHSWDCIASLEALQMVSPRSPQIP